MNNSISWTDQTWNPVTGCDPISAGCKNCYAHRMSKRLAGRAGYPPTPDNFKITLHPDKLGQPLKWRRPRRVFVCSMGDLFHEDVPFEFINSVLTTIKACWVRGLGHTFQILTKRPARMLEYWQWWISLWNPERTPRSFPDNIWLGVTAENQQAADERIPLLLQTPAAVRFVSCEPLLSRIRLDNLTTGDEEYTDALRGLRGPTCQHIAIKPNSVPKLNWVIVGGETGPGARPMHPDWARGLRDQCIAAGVKFHFKSWGEWYPDNQIRETGYRAMMPDTIYHNRIQAGNTQMYRVGTKRAGHLLDGVEWREMPGE